MKVNGLLRDLSALKLIATRRKERILDASPKPLRHDPVKALARILHPENNILKIASIVNISDQAKIIRFISKPEDNSRLPVFQSGQYLSLRIDMEKNSVTRPFFISSPPFKASPVIDEENIFEPYIEIIVVKKENSISNKFIWENWYVDKEVNISFPHGKFFYEPLRDSKTLICFTEDAGIGTFYSLMGEIIQGNLDMNLMLFYKNKTLGNMKLIENFKKLEEQAPTKLKVIVLDDKENFYQELVKLEEKIIKKATFFICCSQVMYDRVHKDLIKLQIPHRRIRKQIFGESINIYEDVNFPIAIKGKTFKITVLLNGIENTTESLPGETVLATLERAEIKKSSHCRSGECGFCRSFIIQGDIFVNTLLDTRRSLDKENGYFHPCVSYPISDLKIDILK